MEYRSPVRKLARFFEQSRNRWKRKCQAAKRRNKLLGNQLRAVEKSRVPVARASQRVGEPSAAIGTAAGGTKTSGLRMLTRPPRATAPW